MRSKIQIEDIHKRIGTIVNKNNLYVFVPLYMQNHKLTIKNIQSPLTKKIRKIDISNVKLNFVKKEISNDVSILENIYKLRDDLDKKVFQIKFKKPKKEMDYQNQKMKLQKIISEEYLKLNKFEIIIDYLDNKSKEELI